INPLAHVLRAATFGRGVFELAAPSGPVIAVNAQNGLDFGNACAGQPLNLTLQVFNVGSADLIIQSVRNLMGSSDFTVLPNPAPPNPATPLVISPNAEVDFTVRYTPLTPGPQQALIRITSSDPGAPFFDLTATGTRTNATIVTAIADSGNFGDVCVGSFKDLGLTIHNAGGCPLRVTGISSSSSQFQTASVVTFPLVVEPGDSIEVPTPSAHTSPGPKSGTIAVASNDPQVPSKVVSVSGNAPTGDIRVTGSTDFSDVCAGVLAEKTISICNVGRCNLNVTNVSLVA